MTLTMLSTIYIVFIILCGPMLLLEVFLGQYTQRGCIFLGNKLPIAYGFGYCLIAGTVLNGAVNIFYAAVDFFYLLVSLVNYPEPPWMWCHTHVPEFLNNKTCIADSGWYGCNSLEPCFNSSSDVFSAELFRNSAAFGMDALGNRPLLKQTSHIIIMALLVFLIASRKFKIIHGVSKFGLLYSLIAFFIILFLIVFNPSQYSMTLTFIYPPYTKFFAIESWVIAFHRVTKGLCLAEGGHMLFGSYMTLTNPTMFRASYLIFGQMIVMTGAALMGTIAVDNLAYVVGVDNPKDIQITSGSDYLYVALPTVIGLLPASQMWATIYFLMLFVLTIQSIVLQVIVVEVSLSEEFNKSAYYLYSRFGVIIVMGCICLLFVTPKGYDLMVSIIYYQKFFLMVIVFIAYTIIFMYSIQRLSDDMHFLLRSPPPLFIKVCWVFTPFCAGFSLIYYIWYAELSHDWSTYVIAASTLSPLLIGFVVMVAVYVKERNLTGLMRPSDKWGPPDLETRTMRQLYNPRFEVRYRRHLEVCKHNCLLNSLSLKRALDKEYALISKILLEIEENDDADATSHKETLVELHRHRELMRSFLVNRKGTGFSRVR